MRSNWTRVRGNSCVAEPGAKRGFDQSSTRPMRGDVKRKFLSMLSWEDGVECIQPSLCSGETLSLRVLRADQAVASLYSTVS
jgi:hypothetical protein